MPVIQSTFNENYAKGYAGMEADGSTAGTTIGTHFLESATCGFGKPVFAGVADKGAVTTPSARLLGFTIANPGLPVISGGRQAEQFVAKDQLRIKNRGSIFVNVSVPVADGEAVYATPAGLITNVSAGNTALGGWEFMETLTAAGIGSVVRR
jgi:hypothetical protein